MDKIAALRKLDRVRAGAGIELKNTRAARDIPRHMIIDLMPHPREMRVIFREGIIFRGGAGEGFGNGLQRWLTHRSSCGVGVAAASWDMCGKVNRPWCDAASRFNCNW